MSTDPELQRLFAGSPLPADGSFTAAVMARVEKRERSGMLRFVVAGACLAAASFGLWVALEPIGAAASAALASAGLPVPGLAAVLMAAALPISLLARRLGSE